MGGNLSRNQPQERLHEALSTAIRIRAPKGIIQKLSAASADVANAEASTRIALAAWHAHLETMKA